MSEDKLDGRPDEPGSPPERVIRAEDLLGDQREVWIELEGVRYRLRVTRRGKLILQK